ncbi:MAG: amino acid ABC transporter ATP-binding protein [Christensenellales bacterium]|jgi:polar amino acid transport system ATP-binding protein
MDEMIRVEHLTKGFGGTQVLKDISFSVGKGQVVAVIGPSGSGKSTLLRCVTQLEQVDSGTIRVCGQAMVEDIGGRSAYAPKEVLRQIRLKIGLVFQSFNLFPHLSVLDNITQAPVRVMRQGKAAARQNALRLLEKMNLADKADAYPYQLSGGQAQRVSIARALALNPEMLFFDEPTSALDPQLTGEILKVIRELAEEHMTMVVVTHEMKFAQEVADHVIFMADGVIIEEGAPGQVFGETASERTRQFLGALDAAARAE